MTNSRALVTGASTGLGEQFSHLFAADGIDIAITSSPRSAVRLEKLAETLRTRYGVGVQTISIDLATPGAAAQLYDAVTVEAPIDYLVNNAAFGIVGIPLQQYAQGDLSRMVQVNVTALAELTEACVRDMVARGSGRILNVSSISGYVVPHGVECGYAASKAFVVSFSECLAQDLRGTGVTCTHLAPGPTRTEFFDTAGLTDTRRLEPMMMDAAPVARAGYEAMMAGKPACIPGVANKLMRAMMRFAPSRRFTALASGMAVRR
ncbi:SDR family NAD(P)-dependent oxidoreductase [Mycobacterium barrassiae]|uniref:SDR family NAD(P)-dependent oxidoreductase n=1 Tax=Mycobacterium barrassiae TaxID=319709 RepID=UPI002265F48A|nr:SDR family NAD(P)-dependent oxidoreductase [Mycobacterium barrassiae]